VSDDYSPPPIERYWLVHANGGRQLIDPGQFDLDHLAEQARRVGGKLVVERWLGPALAPGRPRATEPPRAFEPPVSALAPMFRTRLDRVHVCKVDFTSEFNTRPTNRALGNYYHARRLVRIYTHDRELGRRPLEELFDTYLHEVAHHLEYTEYETFEARACGRVPGRMHSRLFWKILGHLKYHWADAQRQASG
jgi:hypothetical protein